MSRGGWRGLTIDVANKLFEDFNIVFEDRRKVEGGYLAIHPNGDQLRRGTVTECVKYSLKSWFTLK